MAGNIEVTPDCVKKVMEQGYSYNDAMEAYRMVGADPELMMSYLLEKAYAK